MIITLLNVLGIILGAAAGLIWKKPMSVARQQQLKVLFGALLFAAAFRLLWLSFNGTAGRIALQFLIMLLAMSLGKLAGKLLGLQKLSNRAGHYAGERFRAAATGGKSNWNESFLTGVAVFCGGALPVLGAVQAGLGDYWPTLAVKTAIDAFAAFAFAQALGWGVTVSALAVLAYQGSWTLGAGALQNWLTQHALADSVNAVSAMIVVAVALVVFEVKKIELADYLPAMVIAPLLTWWWLG